MLEDISMRRFTLWILGFSIILATGLFHLKHQVVQMEDELVRITHDVTEEKKQLHILEAEWSHLNNPIYLKGLVSKHLPHFRPISPQQIVQFKHLPFQQQKTSIPDSLFQSLPAGGIR